MVAYCMLVNICELGVLRESQVLRLKRPCRLAASFTFSFAYFIQCRKVQQNIF